MGVTTYNVNERGGEVSAISYPRDTGAEAHQNLAFTGEGASGQGRQPSHMTAGNAQSLRKDLNIPHQRGDYLKLAFLIGFPTVFFIVAVVITGTSV